MLIKACARPADPESWQPAYARLEAKGRLAQRVEQTYALLEKCDLCPRRCGINRLEGQLGFCRAPAKAVVYSHQPHFGEELPLVGRRGSGTIFFSNCNLRCVFCQNWPIAHEGWGREVTDEQLADMMLDLQHIGCHNINLVTPTHVMPNIVSATRIALNKGLHLPLCYNTSGYDRAKIVELLDGIVDIYLPDLKFMDGAEASRYNFAAAYDYPEMAQESIIEMWRQVGDLVTDDSGIALRGLMVRHLVMPNRIAGTREFVTWVAENLSPGTYVNIMSQYRVEHKAFEFEPIARAITPEEFVEAMEWAIDAGLTNLDQRSLSQLEIHRRRIP
jgi:putative pyruvate formate lyase activating enzyme